MKKTITVNLNNIIFNIDEDAFELLQNYLIDIEKHLISNENRNCIVLEIEARFARYFSSKLSKNNPLIHLRLVQELIKSFGEPSHFKNETTHSLDIKSEQSYNQIKRFYRDPENGWFGGVAAGMSIYFSWELTLTRLAMFILLILGIGSILPIYLVLWLVVPAAKTPAQKLEMQGEVHTLETLKQELNRLKLHWASNRFKQSAANMGDRLLLILHAFLKGLFWLIGIVSGLVIILLLVGIVTLLVIALFNPTALSEYAPTIFSSQNSVGIIPNLFTIIISLILIIGCPIFMLLFLSIRSISGRYRYSHIASWTVFFIWITSLFVLYSLNFSDFLSNKPHALPFRVHWTYDKTKMVDEVRITEQFDAIELYGNIELVLMNDPVQKLIVSSQADYLSHITTKVEEGILHIYTDEFSFTRDVKIIISSNSIKSLLAKGACSIKTISDYSAPMFTLQLIGASQANMNMKIEGLLSVNIKGASQATFKGSSQTLKFKAVGASKIDASDLQAQFVNVAAVGVSQVKVFASKSLNADAVGASLIVCMGTPGKREIHAQIGSSVIFK